MWKLVCCQKTEWRREGGYRLYRAKFVSQAPEQTYSECCIEHWQWVRFWAKRPSDGYKVIVAQAGAARLEQPDKWEGHTFEEASR